MSVQAMAWVFDYSEAVSNERLVLLAMANHYNNATGLCCPGVKLLAREARVSVSTVKRAIRSLEERGELVCDRRGEGRGNVAQYRLPRFDAFQKRVHADTLSDSGSEEKGSPEREKGSDQENAPIQEPNNPVTPRPRSEAQKVRDQVWDALVVCFGEPQTSSEKSRRGKVVTELVEVGATPPSVIAAHAEAKRRDWSDFTEVALVTNWTSLRNGKARRKPDPMDAARWASGNY